MGDTTRVRRAAKRRTPDRDSSCAFACARCCKSARPPARTLPRP